MAVILTALKEDTTLYILSLLLHSAEMRSMHNCTPALKVLLVCTLTHTHSRDPKSSLISTGNTESKYCLVVGIGEKRRTESKIIGTSPGEKWN